MPGCLVMLGMMILAWFGRQVLFAMWPLLLVVLVAWVIPLPPREGCMTRFLIMCAGMLLVSEFYWESDYY